MEQGSGVPGHRERLTLYVGLITAAGAAAVALAAWRAEVRSPWLLLLLAGLAALAGARPVRFPNHKTELTVTHPFIFLAYAACGTFAATLVAAAGLSSVLVAQARRGRWQRLCFNVGSVLLATTLAGFVYSLTGGSTEGHLKQDIAPLLAAAAVFFLLNTAFVTLAIGIERGLSLIHVWRESFLWTAASYFTGVTLAALLLLSLEHLGPWSLALGIPPSWLLVEFYKSHRARLDEHRRRVEEVEALNAVLERKVVDRTRELAEAMGRLEQANTHLKDANDRLIQASRAKSLFLANVSHELRTPLNAVIGFSDFLIGPDFDNLTPRQRGFLQDIRDSGEHLLHLINDILDLSKIEAGKMEARLEEVDARRILRETVGMVRAQAERKGLVLTVEAAPGLGTIRVDPKMLRQILVNLLSNAVKFTPEGGRVDVRAQNERNDFALEIADTGIGIPAAFRDRIFEEFFQVDGSYSRKYQGTGLGLALVKRMVSLHGGEVSVGSSEGKGSAFRCRFPGAVVEESSTPAPTAPAPTAPIPASAPPAARASTPPPVRSRPLILVVEDDAFSRKLVRNVLRARGYDVLEVPTGEAGLDAALRELPDLVLLDLRLPGIDGLEVARRLKADPRCKAIPLVALSAHLGDELEARALEAGCAGAIPKPIRLAEFPTQIGSFLHQTESAT